jgi:hypothetical protein
MYEEFEDTKRVIRIRKSKKNRQPNDQKDKQRSIKHTRFPLKTGRELRCSGRISSSCFISGTRRVNLVTNPVLSHERGKDLEVFATSVTYPCSFVTQIFQTGQQLSTIHSSMQTINYCYSCK